MGVLRGIGDIMATVNQVGVGLSGSTGSGLFLGSNTGSMTTPTLGVATATSINFGGTALANYLEQTFTPTFTFDTPGDLSVSYGFRQARYTRIGRIVTSSFSLVVTPTYTTASGDVLITGLPFTSAANASGVFFEKNAGLTYPAAVTHVVLYLAAASSTFKIRGFGSATNTFFTTTQFPTATSATFSFTIKFIV